jgi:hypothetical protein
MQWDGSWAHYSTWFNKVVWAWGAGWQTQWQTRENQGELLSEQSIPFYRLSSPDGLKHLRGLEKGRYRDPHLWYVQNEWRMPLFWRFSGVVFGEAGQVFHEFSDWASKPIWAIGAGGRLILSKSKKIRARGDLSWVDGSWGMTIYLHEAF